MITPITFPSPLGRLIPQNLALVFGQFGAGKSFYTVIQAFNAYKRGDIVISNMWLAFPHIRWYTSDELPAIIEEVQDYHDNIATPNYAPNSYLANNGIKRQEGDRPRKFFFLIDEGGLFFNARNFKKNFENPKMIEFFVQPRKYDSTIAIIVQALEMLDVNFRRLAQDVIEFRKWILGLFRLGESYDIKYIGSDEGWNPDTPVIKRKFYLHSFYTTQARVQFFGGLYYTKEILGERAVRSLNHIRTLRRYLQLEKADKENFHNWYSNMTKQQVFGLSDRQAEEDTDEAPYHDR